MKRSALLLLWVLLAPTSMHPVSAQETLRPAQEGITDNAVLQVRAFVEPESTAIARQNVKLIIETATSGWFTGGSKITLPEVPGLVILQNEKFASNSSERRGGETWVVQRWTVDVYPLRAGRYSIPPIELAVRLKTNQDIELARLATTNPLELIATIPPTLEPIDEWVTSPMYSVTQTFDRPLETLNAGDAIEQTIEFRAADVMAMMLPTFTPPVIEGLAAYPAPPVLNNQVNRGQNTASRTTVISYIIEKPGKFVLPAQEYFWWNTRESRLEIITLPTVTLNAAGPAVGNEGLQSGQLVKMLLSAAGVFGLLSLCAAVIAKRMRGRYGEKGRLKLRRLQRAAHAFVRPALPEKLNP